MEFIATFYSHYGAIRFKKYCTSNNMPAFMMPVPRSLSSSCGTCVKYENENNSITYAYSNDEVEQIVQITKSGYEQVYKAEG